MKPEIKRTIETSGRTSGRGPLAERITKSTKQEDTGPKKKKWGEKHLTQDARGGSAGREV